MPTLFMTDWPMFGSAHASLGTNRGLLFGDPFDLSFNKYSALAYLQYLNPVTLYVPGMQEDGLRVDGLTTYFTQLSDLSGNGNHALQTVATAQAYRDGLNAVFSETQFYDANTPSGYIVFVWRAMIEDGTIASSGSNVPLAGVGLGGNGVYDGSGWSNDIISPSTQHNYISDLYTTVAGLRVGARTTASLVGLVGNMTVFCRYSSALSDSEKDLVNQAMTTLGT